MGSRFEFNQILYSKENKLQLMRINKIPLFDKKERIIDGFSYVDTDLIEPGVDLNIRAEYVREYHTYTINAITNETNLRFFFRKDKTVLTESEFPKSIEVLFGKFE